MGLGREEGAGQGQGSGHGHGHGPLSVVVVVVSCFPLWEARFSLKPRLRYSLRLAMPFVWRTTSLFPDARLAPSGSSISFWLSPGWNL